MNTIKLSVPGRAGQNIELNATRPELQECLSFLRLVEYRLYSEGPEWLIDLYEDMEDRFLWG